MAFAALLVALIGVALAGASLTWQVFSWRREGPRVRVTTAFGFPVFGPKLGDQHISVTATNEGRSAVGVQNWGFDLGNGHNAVVMQPLPWSAQLPATLEAGHEMTFFADLRDFEDQLSASGHSGRIRAFVGTATGRVESKPRQLKL
jgi:hypothetical protein